jgi:hypothetical protein
MLLELVEGDEFFEAVAGRVIHGITLGNPREFHYWFGHH